MLSLTYHRKWIAIVCCFFICIGKNYSQALEFSRLTIKNGLESSFVTSFAQDKGGIMWIGTNLGLYRYDGSSFERYGLNTQQQLNSQVVNCLLIDEFDNLYIGTENGLNILSPDRKKITNEKEIKGRICCIKKIDNGDIWVCSHHISKYRNAKWICTLKMNNAKSHLGFEVFSITQIDTDEFDFNFKHNFSIRITAIKIQGIDSLVELNYSNLLTSTKAKNGNYYAVNTHGELIENTSIVAKLETAKKGLGEHITSDAEGNLYIVINTSKVFKYNPRNKSLHNISNTFDKVSFVNTLFTDLYGRVWIGTEKGIFIVSGMEKGIQNLDVKFSDGSERKNVSARKVVELKDKKILLAYNTELTLLSKDSRNGFQYEYLTSQTKSQELINTRTSKRRIELLNKSNFSSIYDMYYDGNESIWCSGLGIHYFNTKAKSISTYVYAERQMGSSYFYNTNHYCLAFDGSKFWLGENNQLMTFDPITEKYTAFKNQTGTEYFMGHAIWDIVCTKTRIYIGSNQGLFYIENNTHKVSKIHLNNQPKIEVNTLHLDPENNLWIGTAGNGVFRINLSTSKIVNFTKKEGLSNETIAFVFNDKRGRIWIGTYYGLNYYNQEKNIFIHFTTEDGLRDNELNRKAFGLLSTGEVIVGGINGYNVFHPDNLLGQVKSLQLRLNKYSKINSNGEQEIFKTGNKQLSEIVLKPGDKLLNIYFALTDYFKNDQHKYYYNISGKMNDWQLIENQNFLSITSLPAGEYVLKIRGATANGQFAENEIILNLRVKQIFYKTWWFITLLFVLVLAIVSYIYFLSLNNLKSLLKLRTKLASDLHDEVGGRLVSISMLSDKMKRENQDNEKRIELQNISNMSRSVISMMKDVIWSIDSRNDSMKDLLDRMYEHLYDMLSGNEIAFNFNHETLKGTEKIDVNFRQNVFLIFKECINNVVKHSGATKVEILFKKEGKHMLLSIKDNGESFVNKSIHTGQGLKNMQMRAKQLNGTIEQNTESGFEIVLTIPVIK